MAIIKIRNAAIDLDAAEIPNLDTSKITTGTFDASRIGSGTLANARISASSVSQHATSFDDNKIVNDISTLALRQASDQDKSAYNTNSQFVDVFQDDTGIDTITNVNRNANEYVSSVQNNTTYLIPAYRETSNYTSVITPSFTGSESTTNSSFRNPPLKSGSGYGGNPINYLFDLSSASFTIRSFVQAYTGSGNSSLPNGANDSVSYYGSLFMVTTDTSVSAGANPAIFASSNANSWYGSADNNFTNSVLSSGYVSTINATSITDYNGTGTTNDNYDLSGGEGIIGKYWNTGAGASTGTELVYTKSTNTIVMRRYGDVSLNYGTGIVTATNVPTTGRLVFGVGDASNSQAKMFSTSYLNGSRINGDFSSITDIVVNTTGNFTGTTITAPSSVSSMGAIITYQDNAGTNALNTDIVLELSADNGSNWSTATLSALPNFSTGIKMAKVNDLAVTAGTQLKYRLNFANQSLGSKEARIRGVALQY